MRAIFITEKEHLRIREVPTPQPGPGEVRVRVEYVGICGSDLHYYFDGANGAFVVREPLTPGHEMSGRVDFDPSGEWAAQTPITVHPGRFGAPDERYPDRPHLWPGGSYLGSAATLPHTQGALAELLIVERAMLRQLPAALPVRRAVLAEPLGIALHAINQSGPIDGKSVLVTGAGPIGLLTIAAARAAGARAVAATDVLPEPLERARAAGADTVYDVTTDGVPDGFDVVFECSGVPASVSTALAATRPAGTVVLVGMMPADPRPVALVPLASRELTVVGSFRFSDEIDAAIELLDSRPELEQVITHEFTAGPVDTVVEAFGAAKDSRRSGKVIIALESTALENTELEH